MKNNKKDVIINGQDLVVIATLETLIDIQKGKIVDYTEKMINGTTVGTVMEYRENIRFRRDLIMELESQIFEIRSKNDTDR